MAISVFDLFTIGIGPSSSHTVGPMRAARRFVAALARGNLGTEIAALDVELYGSLALTGKGHSTDHAVLMGLEGEDPETIDPRSITERVANITSGKQLPIRDLELTLEFDPDKNLRFLRRKSLPLHPNGMRFEARDRAGKILLERTYYSVGGGFVVDHGAAEKDRIVPDRTVLPYPFRSGDELLEICRHHKLEIWQVMLDNERCWHSEPEVRQRLLEIAEAMRSCIKAGCSHEGLLPGRLRVPRRAPELYRTLQENPEEAFRDPLIAIDWVNLFAIAVNEENAGGGRVVTAPTNGAAGIVPAVLEYYRRMVRGADDDGIVQFLLTAAAIGLLFKENASISGAEVGCQGEVGVACSMAAAGLAAVLGGDPPRVENAAEIGMEHNLGLTCDPIAGLVQIPCIERNAMGATKAISAARLALRGDGSHLVSLDKVIRTMRQTGADMKTKYKETSRGGLAINVIEC